MPQCTASRSWQGTAGLFSPVARDPRWMGEAEPCLTVIPGTCCQGGSGPAIAVGGVGSWGGEASGRGPWGQGIQRALCRALATRPGEYKGGLGGWGPGGGSSWGGGTGLLRAVCACVYACGVPRSLELSGGAQVWGDAPQWSSGRWEPGRGRSGRPGAGTAAPLHSWGGRWGKGDSGPPVGASLLTSLSQQA